MDVNSHLWINLVDHKSIGPVVLTPACTVAYRTVYYGTFDTVSSTVSFTPVHGMSTIILQLALYSNTVLQLFRNTGYMLLQPLVSASIPTGALLKSAESTMYKSQYLVYAYMRCKFTKACYRILHILCSVPKPCSFLSSTYDVLGTARYSTVRRLLFAHSPGMSVPGTGLYWSCHYL
jgi:hypothetical protein